MDDLAKFVKTKGGPEIFHMTVVYFWIQMVHYCLDAANEKKTKSEEDKNNKKPFTLFLQKNTVLLDELLFLQVNKLMLID
jgi:hypothetical protein